MKGNKVAVRTRIVVLFVCLSAGALLVLSWRSGRELVRRHDAPGQVLVLPTARPQDEKSRARTQSTLTEPDTRGPAATRRVREFYAEVDKWKVPAGISTNDIASFLSCYDALSAAQKRACLCRALNLIPDANAALLGGFLFDARQSKETIREVFNEIVNRPPEVKFSIFRKILKDPTHPCYSDVKWIYEVTGEKPTE